MLIMNLNAKVSRGSNNVFADIGVNYPERAKARAEVMFLVAGILKKRGLTQKQAAELLGIPQSKISCLINGKLHMFSLDHLFQLLNFLGNDVNITIRPKTKSVKSAVTRVLEEACA
jgi:predicted XRE-type DNA-binding protein